MPTLTQRLPENAPGRFYVDAKCTGCYLCWFLAPGLFGRVSDKECFFLKYQPVTTVGVQLAVEVMKYCPAGAIRDDGDSK